jgi:hypothetical protein
MAFVSNIDFAALEGKQDVLVSGDNIKTINSQSILGAGDITIQGGRPYVRKTTNYTAVDKEIVLADTTGGAFTITLPASPAVGSTVTIADAGNWETHNLTVARNGSTIEGAAANLTLSTAGVMVDFIFDGTTWQAYTQASAAGFGNIPVASAGTLGGVKVGANLSIDGNGVLSANPGAYTLPIASAGSLGGIKVGANLSIDAGGVLSANAGSYTLPTASLTTLGGVKVGANLSIDGNGVLSAAGASVSNDTTTNANRYVGFLEQTSGAASTIFVSSTGLTFNPSAGTLNAVVFNATSDERLKTDIRGTQYGLDTVRSMNIVDFTYTNTGVKSVGVLAQEIQKLVPEAVSVIDDEGHLGVNYGLVAAVLVKAVQELAARVEELSNAK